MFIGFKFGEYSGRSDLPEPEGRCSKLWEQSEILIINLTYKIIENYLSSVGAPENSPSRTPIVLLAPMVITSTTPGGLYDEY
ncbi:hypothetical protein TNCV_1893131 [Trichonephila clavipes]|nr:hypothetical protein TNCV_1893131 [Trichonephila clavipes]